MPSPSPEQRKHSFAPRKTATQDQFRDALLEELAIFFKKKMRSCPEFFSLETETEAAYRQRICRGLVNSEEWTPFSLGHAFKTAERYRYRFKMLELHRQTVQLLMAA